MSPAAWSDTREWLACVEALRELRIVRGASWQRDIGAGTALLDHTEGSPCVLFDEIPGYPPGRRVLVNTNGTLRRQAITLGLAPGEATHTGLVTFWRRVLAGLTPIQPREVSIGPVCECVQEGGDIDLLAFPDAPGQGMDELAWAGAVRGEPVEVVRGRHT